MSANEWMALWMIIILVGGVMVGWPVAWMMAGLGILMGALAFGPAISSYQASLSIFGVMSGWELLAIPLFVFMGVVLEKADIAGRLYLGLRLLFGPIRGGLLLATMGIAILFAACTGIAGASVIAIGLIAMPSMLKYGYDKRLISGAICAGGGLGVIIPPSIMLIVYGPVAGVAISSLFFAAMLPGVVMGLMYIAYMAIMCFIWPDKGPTISREERSEYTWGQVGKILLVAGVPPMGLIGLVLGGIFLGFAAPTEAAALGSLGAIIMTIGYRKFSFEMLKQACYSSLKISTFIMWLVLGAKLFMGTFNKLGGGAMIERWLFSIAGSDPVWMLILMLGIVFILGMFMDWIGILLVVVPIFVPIVAAMKWDPYWFAVMFCVTLQISYITPPFAYSIFYLKGIAPPEVSLYDICVGCVPFILLQILALILIYFAPGLATWLPNLVMAGK
ncbi:MAG: TRAP transporter large permease [Thermodesulfobacteriota bacterium]